MTHLSSRPVWDGVRAPSFKRVEKKDIKKRERVRVRDPWVPCGSFASQDWSGSA